MINVSTTPSFDLNDLTTFQLDIAHPRPKEVLAIVEVLDGAMKKSADIGVLPVVTGWNDITPEKAFNLLLRNRYGVNRRVDPGTAFYYARQMKAGMWKQTGQPILVDERGNLLDSQHRMLAVLISGVTIKSYVVTEIPHEPNIFAFIDNSKPRTAASALQTAGFNGVSAIIVKTIKLGEDMRLGVFDPTGGERLPRLTPAEVLEIAQRYPNAQQASRAAKTDWSTMVDFLGGSPRRHLVAWFAMTVADLNGGEFDLAESFFDEVVDTDERSKDDPIAAFRKKIEDDMKNPSLKPHHVVAAMIKAFNAWQKGESLKGRWMLQVDEAMPVIEASSVQQHEEEVA